MSVLLSKDANITLTSIQKAALAIVTALEAFQYFVLLAICKMLVIRLAGGKTASLKTLGLFALMPKAGLFIPADASKENRLEWFAEVLADVGDSQDLAQNLSTFSGHVQRLKRITTAVSPSSLVLLDEVSSGGKLKSTGEYAALLAHVWLPQCILLLGSGLLLQ